MLNQELNVCNTKCFSKDYYYINKYLIEEGTMQESRYGKLVKN